MSFLKFCFTFDLIGYNIIIGKKQEFEKIYKILKEFENSLLTREAICSIINSEFIEIYF